MAIFSRLLDAQKTFTEKNPIISIILASLVLPDLGFPYNILPSIPAVASHLDQLMELPVNRARRSVFRSLINLLVCLGCYVASKQLPRRKKMTLADAVEFVFKKWIKFQMVVEWAMKKYVPGFCDGGKDESGAKEKDGKSEAT